MADNEKRTYQRSDDFLCTAHISKDGVKWKEVNVFDLSSGGLKLNSIDEYQIGDRLWFDLKIHGFLSEFDIKVLGKICRKESTRGQDTFGVRFEGLSQDKKIHIDECVRSFRPKELWD